MITAKLHAMLNACLNGTCAALLLIGYAAMKRHDRDTHRRCMLAAFGVSVIFLVSYLLRVALHGTTPFLGTGLWRAAYFFVLFTHMTLAVCVPVMAVRSIYLGLRDRIAAHRGWARWTFPAWLYVSVTGVLVYVMLYEYPGR